MRKIDPELSVDDIRPMDSRIADSLVVRRSPALLAAVFSGLALLLTAIGTYGVLSYAVAQRRREIGVRMALGAQRTAVVWLVLRGALAVAAVGVVIGGPLALGAGRALRSLLYGIAPASPLVLGGAAAALVGVAIIASAAPAWRASRVDPLIALRSD